MVDGLAAKPAVVKEVDCGNGDADDAVDLDEARGTTALHSQIRLSSLFELSIKQPSCPPSCLATLVVPLVH